MRLPTEALMKAVSKKRRPTDGAGGSKKKPRAHSPPPSSSGRQAGEGATSVAPMISVPAATPSAPPAVPQASPPPSSPIDLTTETPPEEMRAATARPSADPIAAGAGSEQCATAPASGEGPSTGGREDAGAAGDSPTGEGRGGAPSAPGEAPAPSASAGSGRWRRTEGDSSRVTLTYRGRTAERVLTRVCQPELQAEFSRLSASTILRDAFASHLWAVNCLTALRDTIHRSEHALQDVSTAQARAERAEGALEVARREGEAGRKEAEGARQEAETARREAEAARRETEAARREAEESRRLLRDFQGEVEEVRRQGAADLGRARVAEAELAKAEAALGTCRERLNDMHQDLRDLEGRAENAEEIARQADARAADADAEVASVRARADQAEARAAAAEGTEAEILDRFRDSAEFIEEVAEASADAYLRGFRDGKEKAARTSGIASLNDLEPDLPEEPTEGGDAPADD